MKNGTGWICVLASKNMFRRVLEQVMKCCRAASMKKTAFLAQKMAKKCQFLA
jgi:hypothetical protein